MIKTPGPWRLKPIAGGKAGYLVVGSDNHNVLMLPFGIRAGDAKLIAAAPQLLEGLKGMNEVCKTLLPIFGALDKAAKTKYANGFELIIETTNLIISQAESEDS